jgi:hypothetical protein
MVDVDFLHIVSLLKDFDSKLFLVLCFKGVTYHTTNIKIRLPCEKASEAPAIVFQGPQWFFATIANHKTLISGRANGEISVVLFLWTSFKTRE